MLFFRRFRQQFIVLHGTDQFSESEELFEFEERSVDFSLESVVSRSEPPSLWSDSAGCLAGILLLRAGYGSFGSKTSPCLMDGRKVGPLIFVISSPTECSGW